MSRSDNRADAAVTHHQKRLDIQGMRAIAVGLVVVYHAGAPWLPGGYVGVDVFFVISGFLITGLLLREQQIEGRISLGGFYARRAKRILPAATLVLVASAILAYTMLPRSRWEETATQVIGSALYVVNWLFAGSAVDYLKADSAESIVQHFWTLAVEEQFYIVWPILLIAAVSIAGRSVSARRWTIAAAAAIITAPSFAYSVYATANDPSAAYFVTTTRLWELGLGACAAIAAPFVQRHLRRGLAIPLSWVGLAGIVAAGVLYDSTTPFPSYTALLPTAGAAALLLAGGTDRSLWSAGGWLSFRPFTWVGDISYSLYLWHWPLIVVATYQLGGSLTFAQGLVVVALSTLPAWLSYTCVENPILQAPSLKYSPKPALQLGAFLMSIGAIAGLSLGALPTPVIEASGVDVITQARAQTGGDPEEQFGAAAVALDPEAGAVVDQVDDIFPDPAAAPNDNPSVYAVGCHKEAAEDDPEACAYGDLESKTRVVLVGDSHAAQFQPPLELIADEQGWRLETYTKSGCPLNSAAVHDGEGRRYESCERWNESLQQQLAADPPAVVITADSHYRGFDGADLGQGLSRSWERLQRAGITVLAIADTPRPGELVPECVERNRENLSECAVEKSRALRLDQSLEALAVASGATVPVLDLNDLICPPQGRCPAVVGSVLVYRDTNHLTATFSATLADRLETLLRENVPADLFDAAEG